VPIQILIAIAITIVVAVVLWKLELVEPTTVIVGSVIAVILSVGIILAGWSIFKADKLSFNEYWNGYEKEAIFQVQQCSRDSGCAFTYACDPYQVAHTTTSTDSKGNVTTSTYYTTEYHSCPYVTQEWLFSIDTTLGDYFIARTISDHPQEYRAGNGIPNVARGVPNFWNAAKIRIDAGRPGPVTKRMKYDNYLLASDKTILNQYSDKIKELLDAKLLPKVTSNIKDHYYADKVYFVGYQPEDRGLWEDYLSYLNAGFGTELQGDVHLVITQNASIQPDSYITALKAYWSNPAVFDDDAISKNSVIIALGAKDGKVAWARAITGMPLGNELMLHEIQSKLVGVPMTPNDVIGYVASEFYTKDGKTKARSVAADGGLYRILWGLDNPASKFKRVSMSGGDKDDNGSGFGYLSEEIQPSDTQQLFIMLIALIPIATAFVCCYLYDTSDPYSYRSWR